MDGTSNLHVYVANAGRLRLFHRETTPIGLGGQWRSARCDGLVANPDWHGPGVGPTESVFVHHGCVDELR